MRLATSPSYIAQVPWSETFEDAGSSRYNHFWSRRTSLSDRHPGAGMSQARFYNIGGTMPLYSVEAISDQEIVDALAYLGL